MEGMLQAVIVMFMLFLCSLCLFAIVVIVRDIIHENGKIKRERTREEIRMGIEAAELAELVARSTAAKEEAASVEPEVTAPIAPPAAEPVAKEVPAEPEATVEPEAVPEPEAAPETEEPAISAVFEAEEESEPEAAVDNPDGNAVVFSRHTLTLEERYAMLSTEFKRYFDDIIRHAAGKDGVRELKYSNYNDYKIGSYRVLRITIKRGEIVCEFRFLDRDFLNYANSSNVKMKQSATTINVTEPSAVGAVKDGIDLVCAQIVSDKEYKKNLANEKRREKRRKEREESAAVSEGEAVKEKVNV